MSYIEISHVHKDVAIGLVDEGHLSTSFPGALSILVSLAPQQIRFKYYFRLIQTVQRILISVHGWQKLRKCEVSVDRLRFQLDRRSKMSQSFVK